MYPWVTKNVFYLPIERLRGEPVTRYLRAIEEFERLTSEEMSAVQFNRVKKLLKFVDQKNAFYREQLRRANLTSVDIKTLEDFERIPFLTKKLLRDNYASMISESPGRISLRKTSGSTGEPLKLVKDRAASAYMDAYMYHVYSWYGIEIGSRQARIWGIPLEASGRMLARVKDLLLNRRRLVSFEISPDRSCRFYTRLRRFRPFYLYGLITPIHQFALELVKSGINPSELGLRVIIATGERLHPGKKEYVKSVFDCPVVNEYGCTESGIIAFECPSGSLHLANHNLLVEIINPVTGKVAEVGESGEVALTELFATGMPLIRYRIGDLAYKKANKCTCGRNSPVIGDIVGRTSELIPTPDGRKVAAALIDYAMPASVSRFRAIQTAIDELVVYLECPQPLTPLQLSSIQSKISQYLGKQMKIEMRIVDNIPRDPSGKLRCFISKVETSNSNC